MPSDSSHHIEVPVPAQKWKVMMPTERRNPEIIGWNRLSRLSEFNVDSCIVMRGLHGDVQHRAVDDQTVQPASIPNFVPRLGAILSYNHYWEC
jgi:hypothetical protein